MIHQGDALTVLRTMPAESVQCCVTSPPYWGLRDYGTAAWEGGSEACDHSPSRESVIAATMQKTGLNTATNGLSENQMAAASARMRKSPCPRCGAIRIDSQLGLEKTPEEYVARMVEVFRDVRRVLKDDGVLWLNLGDSYANTGGMTGGKSKEIGKRADRMFTGSYRALSNGLKPKDLVGIPWRVAFALQEAGWYLRCDVIWSKPNPMPESVQDRPTRAHEYVFLLSKNERYFYDSKAVAEPASQVSIDRLDRARLEGWAPPGSTPHRGSMGARAAKTDKQRWHGRRHDGFNARWDAMPKAEQCGSMRNKRSVWNIATRPFPEAHFATFPEEIPTVCILAGSRPGDVVLDPFNGAGTVGVVCEKLGRSYVGIELNPAYVAMAEKRIANVAPLFNQEQTA